MEPDGDPEARIRDLERPLTPHQVPHPYESQYYSAPPQVEPRRSRTALWLIPLAIAGVIGVGIAGSVLYFTLGGSGTGSTVRPDSPNVAGGFGSLDAPEVDIVIPEIDTPSTPSEDVVTVGAGDTLSFGGIEQNKTIVCNQGTVNISGVTNTIEIQGDCASITVSGMDNIITVEMAQSITTSGVDNHVTYRAGAPEVSKSGSGNVIEQG